MSVKVITGVVRLSYAWLNEPRANKKGVLKYGAQLIIPKDDTKTIADIDKAIEEEFAANFAKLGFKTAKLPKSSPSFKLPWRDGDEERDDDSVAGCMFINTTSDSRPSVVNLKLQEIIDPHEIYSGMYARVSITVKEFTGEAKGITCYLNHVQKVKEGDRLDGRASAVSDFKDFGGDEWEDPNAPDGDDEDDYVM